MFLEPDAPMEINIGSRLKQKWTDAFCKMEEIRAKDQDPECGDVQELWDQCKKIYSLIIMSYESILNLMAHDPFVRFRATQEFRDLNIQENMITVVPK